MTEQYKHIPDKDEELEEWFDKEYPKTVWPQAYVSQLCRLIRFLRKERDQTRSGKNEK